MYTVSSSNMSTNTSPSASIAAASGAGRGGKESLEFARTIKRVFEETYGCPSLSAATIRRTSRPDTVGVDLITSQRDFAKDTKRKVARTVLLSLQHDTLETLVEGPSVDVGTESAALQSPTDTDLRIVLRNGKAERFVEIWRKGRLVNSHDVTKAHGEFYSDSTFGSLAWSNDNTHVVYAAERPEYAKATGGGAESPDRIQDMGGFGNYYDDVTGSVAGFADPRRYQWESDWGETFNGKRPPVLVSLRISDGHTSVVSTPSDVSPGQALFLPGPANRIAFIGYIHGARKHGIVYCQNRPSGLYIGDLDGSSFECVHQGALRSPRLAPAGDSLVFLSTAPGGPHAAASEIVRYGLEDGAIEALVPIVAKPLHSSQVIGGTELPAGFPGIYADQLPLNPWLRTEHSTEAPVLALTSTWRSTSVVLTLDMRSRKLERQSPVDGTTSATVLGCTQNLIAVRFSTPTQPGTLAIGKIPASSTSETTTKVSWFHDKSADTRSDIKWDIVQSPLESDSGTTSDDSTWESIFVYPPTPPKDTSRYFWPNEDSPRPLVVVPHGGPHSAYSLDYDPLTAGLVSLGFGVLRINFTGSLGFGQDAVMAQIGNMDTLSLDEIQAAASSIHKTHRGDPHRTVYLGGSYSGYTGALLAARVPGFYRGIVLRNPVISLADNVAMSDIPDWCWAELGLDYSFEDPPAVCPRVNEQMWAASPSSLADKVQDPILLLLGASDRRVPPPQSTAYFARLKAAGKPVQCKVYPNVGHPLDTVEAERDSFITIARFFAASLQE
ncbi:hypothetical protein GGI07_002105 [Coemansia sp. Benny D115]|nr:hypothetical protein GGI07_002105 [Coemansia sp. Benny D115]